MRLSLVWTHPAGSILPFSSPPAHIYVIEKLNEQILLNNVEERSLRNWAKRSYLVEESGVSI